MKNSTRRKMTLNRETVRDLAPRELGAVNGGASFWSNCVGICVTATCRTCLPTCGQTCDSVLATVCNYETIDN